MKVALCLRGIHWLQSYQDKKNNNFYQIDWRKNIKNIRLTIIKPFKKKGIEIDIYISTNQSELQEEYYNSFNPRPKYFNAYDIETNGKIYLPVKRRTLELLREVKKSNEKYEYIIVSRPDLSLKTEILNINQRGAATPRKKYVLDNGDVYIGQDNGRLTKRDNKQSTLQKWL